MDALVIEGPSRLKGLVKVSGSKNSALPFLFAALLQEKEVCFSNVPRLWDIETTLHILESMGATHDWNKEDGILRINPTVTERVAPYEWVKRMRAGVLALGPLVARFGEAKVSLPGGCAIGARPVDYHLEAMRKLGVTVDVEEGYIKAKVHKELKGAVIQFPQCTVTGTANLMMLATAASGITVLENSAREPEVVALGEVLKTWGAQIEGLGTTRIEIKGKRVVAKGTVPIPPDRIETGTWIAIAAATQNELTITDCNPAEMGAVLATFQKMGVGIEKQNDTTIKVTPNSHYHPLEITTGPYPEYPTDMQAQLLATLCFAKGRSKVTESIFENRFMHVAELNRLGAKIEVEDNRALIEGVPELSGAPIMATDLRASASLVVAALAAKGTTRISRIYHLDRGYQKLDHKLLALGAKIQRIVE